MSFLTHERNGLMWLAASHLEDCAGVLHGFSTRQGGVSNSPFHTLNLGIGRGDAQEAVEENYRRFCAAIGTDVQCTVLSNQVHGDNVLMVTADDAGKGLWRPRDYQADALITNVPGLALTVFSADCGTALLYDPFTRSVGAVHAGWRGVANGILSKTVSEMGRCYGTRPENLLVALGPCIGPCCFETDGDVPEAMYAAFGAQAEPFITRQGAKYHVDLRGLNRLWLLRAGVSAGQIQVCELCTACRPDLFWSHRKMGQRRGAQVAQIALRR